MKIIGIDPGFDRIGIAVIERMPGQSRENVLHTECFTTKRGDELDSRISAVAERINHIINEYGPTVMAIESLFATKNLKTVMGVSEARGVIKYIAGQNGLKIYEYTPNQIKVAITGSGAATKDQIQYMVPKLVGIDIAERSKQMGGTSTGLDDELDALAVALTCSAIEK
jgi:crossover junction endodeoxyribonuclease RuvC